MCDCRDPLYSNMCWERRLGRREAILRCRMAEQIQAEKNKYLVLLIITDGAIHDMDETIRLIVRGADLPLSILIVGVGNDDFGNMEVGEEGGDEE